jgi:SMODS-associated NUDIX domain
MKGKVSFLLGILGLISAIFISDTDAKGTVFKIALGFVSGAIIELIVYLFENRKNWKFFKTLFLKPNKPIRATVAYLFRIEVNGKYVLIKRHKNDRIGYQPIGGAFKYFKEENRELFHSLGIVPCNRVQRDSDTKDDLRIEITKRRRLLKFIKWFEGRKNREVDPWREFYEELVEPGLLPESMFKHVKYAFIYAHKEIESPSPIFNIDEFRYAEIYELRPDTDEQKKAIAELIDKGEIIFATSEEIRRGSTDSGKIILPHSKKILPQ